jgi:protein TonB
MLHLLTATNNLDEVVFANRNKAYGAYQIRKQYDATVTRALFIVLSSFLILFFIGLMSKSPKPIKLTTTADDVVKWVATEIDIPIIDLPVNQMYQPEAGGSSTNESYEITTDKKVVQNVVTNPVSAFTSSNLTGKIIGNAFNPLSSLPGKITATATPGTSSITIVELMPVFNNGNGELGTYLENNIVYPDRARAALVTGKVVVSFDVDENGKVSDVVVEQGIGFGCDEEAVRVIENMPPWKPAIQNGSPKAVRMRLPIEFRLN